MSLTDLDLKALKEAAGYFGVDIEGVRGKLNIIGKLENDGVDYVQVKAWYDRKLAAEEAEKVVHETTPFTPEAPVAEEDQIILKMERKNVAYETFGYRFTREHPFVAVPESAAQVILENEDGFRIALKSEVEVWYS
jgi:hypothetical protein